MFLLAVFLLYQIIIALTSTAIFVLIVSVRLNRKQDHSTTDKIIPTVDVEHKAKNVTIIAHLISLFFRVKNSNGSIADTKAAGSEKNDDGLKVATISSALNE